MNDKISKDGGKSDTGASKINVRMADYPGDLEFLRPVSIEFHAKSRFSDIPYSHKKRDALFVQAFNNPDRAPLMLAEYDGKPVGFLFCTAGEYLVGYTELIKTVYSFYVRKKYRGMTIGGKSAIRLLNGAIKWSKMLNVREIMIHVTSDINIQHTDKFLRRAGFEVIGANYSLSLNNPKDGG